MIAGARVLLVGTRRSRLARIQTDMVLEALRSAPGAPAFEVRVVRTEGDRTQALDTPLQDLPRGVFVKELETALLDGAIDLAVHSLKDMTVDLTDGLTIAAVLRREDPRDVLVARTGMTLASMPPGARVGTSSPRRARQLAALRPDLRFEPIRGNVDTRVRKVEQGEYDAAILAAAGLMRLGLQDRIAQYFDPEECLPDPGQGALAVEARADEGDVLSLLASVNDGATSAAVIAERVTILELGGGCKVPIGVLGEVDGEALLLRGLVASPDSDEIVRARVQGRAAEPEAAGRSLAAELRALGAERLLVG